ncbi:DUF7512 family protein [Halarchaeum sp. P4]
MMGLETLSEPLQAAAAISVVFAESLALYVVYGALSRLVTSTVLNSLGGE